MASADFLIFRQFFGLFGNAPRTSYSKVQVKVGFYQIILL
jgi:hypothetical protein